jgi:hypothetical protein
VEIVLELLLKFVTMVMELDVLLDAGQIEDTLVQQHLELPQFAQRHVETLSRLNTNNAIMQRKLDVETVR